MSNGVEEPSEPSLQLGSLADDAQVLLLSVCINCVILSLENL